VYSEVKLESYDNNVGYLNASTHSEQQISEKNVYVFGTGFYKYNLIRVPSFILFVTNILPYLRTKYLYLSLLNILNHKYIQYRQK
jgi:hypothetical protein